VKALSRHNQAQVTPLNEIPYDTFAIRIIKYSWGYCLTIFSYTPEILSIVLLGVLIRVVRRYFVREKSVAEAELSDAAEAELRRDKTWESKLETAAQLIVQIGPKIIATPSGATSSAFETVFSKKELRDDIEMYLVYHDERNNTFIPKLLDRDEIDRAEVHETILEVLEAIEQFKKQNPDTAAKQLGI
jgi:hypothetical protein